MPTALTRPGRVELFDGPIRLFTLADVAAMPSDLPSGAVRYELDDGRLVIMPPTGAEHSPPHVRVVVFLFNEGEAKGYGKLFIDPGVVLWRNPDRLVGPDAAFVTTTSLPVQRSKEGYLETIPELVAEIRSENDSIPEIETKVSDYHNAGVQVVWVLDPEKRTVTVYPNGGPSQTLDAAATLTADRIIPGFQVLVGNLFV